MLAPLQLPFPLRAVNALGASARRLGLDRRNLDPDRLIDAARQETGLNDFGPGPFRRELDILVESLEREAHLSFLGRSAVRNYLLDSLRIQLRIQDCFNRHPEIAAQPITAPVIIIGMPRSYDFTGRNALVTGGGYGPDVVASYALPDPVGAAQQEA